MKAAQGATGEHMPSVPARATGRGAFGMLPSRVGFETSIRCMAAMGGPILVGTLFGQPVWGAVASVGTLAAPFVGNWSFRQRVVRLGGHALVMAVTYTLGALGASNDALSVAVLASVATIALLVGGLIGAWAGPFAVIAANVSILGTGLTAGFGPDDPGPWAGGLLVLLAGAWVLFVNVVGLSVRGHEPETQAVAVAYTAIADHLGALGGDAHDQARMTARRLVFDAWDALGDEVPPTGSPRARLFVLLQDAQRILDASVAVGFRRPEPVPPELPIAVRAVGVAVANPEVAQVVRPPSPGPQASSALLRLHALIERALRDARDAAPEPAASPTPLRETLMDRLEGMRPVREVQVRVALRVGLAVGLAQAVGLLAGVERGYWIALTTLLVLQPDPANTQIRAAQRAVGTVAGVVLLGPLLLLSPDVGLLALGMIVVGYLLPGGFARSYLSAATLLTLYALMLTDVAIGGQTSPELLLERIVDTTAGCAIAVAATWLLWPRAATRRVPAAIASAMRAEAQLLLARFSTDPPRQGLARERRRLLLLLLNVQSLVSRAAVEPPTSWPTIEGIWPVATLSLRAGVRVATRTGSDDTQPLLSVAGAEEMAQTLHGLAGAVESGSRPAALTWLDREPARSDEVVTPWHRDLELLHGAVADAARPDSRG